MTGIARAETLGPDGGQRTLLRSNISSFLGIASFAFLSACWFATFNFHSSTYESLALFLDVPRPMLSVNKVASDEHQGLMSITNSSMPRILKKIHLVFMGDSVTRYQYLSLSYYLRWSTWWDPAKHPNLVNEKTYGSWTDFYRRTTAEYAPYSQCDCFRPENFDPTLTFENRYFWDPRFNNSLTYIQAFGHHGSHGHFFAGDVLMHRPAVLSTVSPLWKLDWPETITQHIAKLQPKPDFVVLNAGLWVNDYLNHGFQNAVVSALKAAGITGIWKTTTFLADKGYSPQSKQVDEAMCNLMSLCLNLSWTKSLNSTSYWDNFHFNEPIYKRMNIQLLGLIQNSSHSYV